MALNIISPVFLLLSSVPVYVSGLACPAHIYFVVLVWERLASPPSGLGFTAVIYIWKFYVRPAIFSGMLCNMATSRLQRFYQHGT